MSLVAWRWNDDVVPLAAHLRAGGLALIPSESSYGIAVDPRNPRGVEAVYDSKRRDSGKPLPVVVASLEQLPLLGISATHPAVSAVASLWPAALTVVVPVAADLPAAAGTGSLAIRIPAHERLRQLLEDLAMPLTATSANRSGQTPVCDPAALARLFSDREEGFLVDDGVLAGGPPSTILAWEEEGWRLLREGAFPVARLPFPLLASAAMTRDLPPEENRHHG